VHKKISTPFQKLDNYSSKTAVTLCKIIAKYRYNYNHCTFYVVLHNAKIGDAMLRRKITATWPYKAEMYSTDTYMLQPPEIGGKLIRDKSGNYTMRRPSDPSKRP